MIRSASRIDHCIQIRQPISNPLGMVVVCLAGLVGFAFLGCSKTDANKPVAEKSETIAAKAVKAAPPEDSSPKGQDKSTEKSPDKPIDDAPAVNDPAFHAGLTEAIDSYLQFPMANSVALVAPADCAPPSDDPRPMMSNSDHESTHGQKLYYLFVKNITHYLSQDGSPSPEGQILVKESWTSKASNPGARNLRNHASGLRINPRVTVGDDTIEIGKRKDLFVMMKLAPDTDNTDNGWVYGVVDPNSQEVTASGKVASCMRCHEDAKNDRLFGPAVGN